MATQILTQTRAKKQETPTERGKALGRDGYSIAESAYCRNLYEVRRPDGVKYLVDVTARTCSCPASVPCKHLAFVDACRRFAERVDRLQRAVDWARVDMEEARSRGRLVAEFETTFLVKVAQLADVVGEGAWAAEMGWTQ